MPTVYIFLGASLHTQSKLAEHFQTNGLDTPSAGVLYFPEDSGPSLSGPSETWMLDAGGTLTLPASAQEQETIFLLSNPSADPRPLLEGLARNREAPSSLELGRIFTIADCKQLSERPELKAFYELCLHFSDVFLLGNRNGVSKKWVQGYIDQLKKLAIPTRIEYLKAGDKLERVSEFLYPEARRVSQIFDPPDDPIDPGLIIESVEEEDAGDLDETSEFDPRALHNDPFLCHLEDGSYKIKLSAFPKYP